MSFLSSTRRTLTLLVASAAAVASACNPSTVAPTDNADSALEAQMAANLAVMAQAKQHSAVVFDSLTRVWESRGQGRGTLMNVTSGTFVACAPQPYDGDAKVVTTSGGVFTFGPHKLTVPAGALSQSTAMAVIVQTDLKTKVTLLPHGTQFNTPVKLTLSYTLCESSPTHRVAYIDALSNVLEWPTSADHPETQKVDTWLSHFSEYAIAY